MRMAVDEKETDGGGRIAGLIRSEASWIRMAARGPGEPHAHRAAELRRRPAGGARQAPRPGRHRDEEG